MLLAIVFDSYLVLVACGKLVILCRAYLNAKRPCYSFIGNVVTIVIRVIIVRELYIKAIRAILRAFGYGNLDFKVVNVARAVVRQKRLFVAHRVKAQQQRFVCTKMSVIYPWRVAESRVQALLILIADINNLSAVIAVARNRRRELAAKVCRSIKGSAAKRHVKHFAFVGVFEYLTRACITRKFSAFAKGPAAN